MTAASNTPPLDAARPDGDAFANDGEAWFEMVNDGQHIIEAVFHAFRSDHGEPVEPRLVMVRPGERKKIGPFNPRIFNDDAGRVHVTYSRVDGLQVGVFRYALPAPPVPPILIPDSGLTG